MTNPVEKALAKIADKFGDVVTEEGARVRALIQAGLTQTLNAQRITGARPAAILPNARNATGRGRLVGWSLSETAGAAATVTVYAAQDGNDPQAVLAVIPLTANAGSTHLPALPGVFFAEGVYVAVAGAVAGALYFGAVD